VVAGGGSTVGIVDGIVLVDGTPVPLASSAPTPRSGPYRVPAAFLFVLGDNLPASRDSRDFGPVPCDSILARAVAVYWPPRRIGLIRREPSPSFSR
jgi:signal peptidase I